MPKLGSTLLVADMDGLQLLEQQGEVGDVRTFFR